MYGKGETFDELSFPEVLLARSPTGPTRAACDKSGWRSSSRRRSLALDDPRIMLSVGKYHQKSESLISVYLRPARRDIISHLECSARLYVVRLRATESRTDPASAQRLAPAPQLLRPLANSNPKV